MGLFEEAVQTARSAAKTVGKKAEEVLDLSKRKFAVSELEGKLEDAFSELGRIYYRVLKDETFSHEEVDGLVVKIDELEQQLELVREDIARVTRKTVCPACGADCDSEAAFCSSCGEKLIND